MNHGVVMTLIFSSNSSTEILRSEVTNEYSGCLSEPSVPAEVDNKVDLNKEIKIITRLRCFNVKTELLEVKVKLL